MEINQKSNPLTRFHYKVTRNVFVFCVNEQNRQTSIQPGATALQSSALVVFLNTNESFPRSWPPCGVVRAGRADVSSCSSPASVQRS